MDSEESKISNDERTTEARVQEGKLDTQTTSKTAGRQWREGYKRC